MKKDVNATANALAVTTAVLFVVCRILVGLFPDASFVVAQSWFHGIALSKLGGWNLTTASFFLGLISSTVIAWLVGYLFAKVYNAFAK